MEKTTLEKEKLYDSLPPDQKMKLEIAEELGLLDKINGDGWKSLTPKETGRIGGLMTKRKREMKSKLEAEAAMIEDAQSVEC
ncbi:MAG: small acid-soluble spore protein alpha/beta type [Epulopiscium sp. Nele67-Bin004]|nr:MAG: small acid-soluble spore protein alpha/beta type [Epulopiscium sp. Nele67-Bin004]